ncbi:hypothetical protein STBHUCCB_p2070 (plasmid) [Salmonella enterica subsp. enterica serovar Typhi str. P-stx-12]|nr:hypothetical protein STBHUCCB_p2070 [Salmonella enterica subsp. enterica serovar Typhi str. P-stx-12]
MSPVKSVFRKTASRSYMFIPLPTGGVAALEQMQTTFSKSFK